ncbi:MAG: hypothetical protein HY583_04345 [Candidatus Omnitrophica bacterium]|nr:hypothetical protein [Candidatus Omnitrophota bacterium]
MLQDLVHDVVEAREWSWSVVGLIVILTGLLIRGVLLRGILRGIKIRNRSWYSRTQKHYQKRALVGWIFFILFAAGITLFWRFETVFLKYLSSFKWLVIFTSFLLLSLFLHLRAYASAIVESVEENIAADKDI